MMAIDGRYRPRIQRFSDFPAVSLPRLRFDRRVARKVLIRKGFSMPGEPRKNFSLSFPEWQGRGVGGVTLPSFVPSPPPARRFAASFFRRPGSNSAAWRRSGTGFARAGLPEATVFSAAAASCAGLPLQDLHQIDHPGRLGDPRVTVRHPTSGRAPRPARRTGGPDDRARQTRGSRRCRRSRAWRSPA
jgi:hypothetical protein